MQIDGATLHAAMANVGLGDERLFEVPWHDGAPCAAISISDDRDALLFVLAIAELLEGQGEAGFETAREFARHTVTERAGRGLRLCLPGVRITG